MSRFSETVFSIIGKGAPRRCVSTLPQRYSDVRDRLDCFETFLQENKLGEVVPRQYEMTYVNHIPLNEGRETLRDVGKVFPDFAWRVKEDRFLSVPGSINWRTSFPLPNREGRLHATLRSATRNSDGQPIFLFELTARGMNKDSSPEGMWRWFDLAREWIGTRIYRFNRS